MKERIKKLLEDAILSSFARSGIARQKTLEAQKWPDFELPEITIDCPKNEQFGDYTSNVAMILARKIGKNPMEVAGHIVEALKNLMPAPSPVANDSANWRTLPRGEEKFDGTFEVAAPGYINFYLSEKYLQDIVGKINTEKNNFGNSELGKGVKINNEFISANPTGPLHLGNGRGGFYGDSLSRILRKDGFEVTNEYYVNDAGEQVMKLGHSVLKDDEAVYGGEYIDELEEMFGKIRDIRGVGEKAAKYILENYIQKTAKEKMQIDFDVWFSEKYLHENGYVEKAIETLKSKGFTYEKDDALWLKTTVFGDDKDRVLIKKDGNKTYFASDCGYILNKMERGFDRIIEIWGADHHGYISRFKAAAEALGFQKEQVKFVIVQLVKLVKDGKEVRMSKRAGNVVAIDELIDEVGHDVARFFFLMYCPDTHMNFDLGLAKERSQKNPVFYVQYAHARICSILQKANDLQLLHPHLSRVRDILSLKGEGDNGELLSGEKELSLIKELNRFPELIEEIAENYEVHKLPHYAIKLADKFHSFYTVCKVIDEENPQLTEARLSLVNAVRIVLKEALELIGVEAPDKM